MKRGVASVFWVCAAFVICCERVDLCAQASNATGAATVGTQAVKVVLKHFTINPLAADPITHQPLRADGSWSLSKSRPTSCPQSAETCVEVFYAVPEQSAKCSWVLSLNEDGTDGDVLDENDDSDNYMVRTVSGSEASPFVKSRTQPVYPPIAIVARVSGSVVTRVMVGRSGEVQRVRVISGPPMLLQTSIDAAKSWTFVPMTIGTRTVQYEIELVFTFSLISPDVREGMVKTAP